MSSVVVEFERIKCLTTETIESLASTLRNIGETPTLAEVSRVADLVDELVDLVNELLDLECVNDSEESDIVVEEEKQQ